MSPAMRHMESLFIFYLLFFSAGVVLPFQLCVVLLKLTASVRYAFRSASAFAARDFFLHFIYLFMPFLCQPCVFSFCFRLDVALPTRFHCTTVDSRSCWGYFLLFAHCHTLLFCLLPIFMCMLSHLETIFFCNVFHNTRTPLPFFFAI